MAGERCITLQPDEAVTPRHRCSECSGERCITLRRTRLRWHLGLMDIEVAKADEVRKGSADLSDGVCELSMVIRRSRMSIAQDEHRLKVLPEMMIHREYWVGRSEVEHHFLARQPIRLPSCLKM